MKTLLVSIDFSNSTEIVVITAKDLASDLDAKIILFHVVEPVETYLPVGASMDIISAPAPNIVPDENILMKRLHQLAEKHSLPANRFDCRTAIGLAVSEILDAAESSQADFILLGSHGHGALYHLFSGSVVTGILKKTTRPVIVVPSTNNPSHKS